MNLTFYLAFNFIFYSFVGWILEEVYNFSVTKSFKKEGFLIGPFKPMYGIGFTLLIICDEVLDIDGISLTLLCFLIPTTVEYISGSVLKHFFNKVYWDYSEFKYNIHGFVTPKFSLYWMILSLIGLYYFQSNLHSLYIENESFFSIVVILGCIVLSVDLYLTMKKSTYERLKNMI